VDVLLHKWAVGAAEQHAGFAPHFARFLASVVQEELGIGLEAPPEMEAKREYAGGSTAPGSAKEAPAPFLLTIRKGSPADTSAAPAGSVVAAPGAAGAASKGSAKAGGAGGTPAAAASASGAAAAAKTAAALPVMESPAALLKASAAGDAAAGRAATAAGSHEAALATRKPAAAAPAAVAAKGPLVVELESSTPATEPVPPAGAALDTAGSGAVEPSPSVAGTGELGACTRRIACGEEVPCSFGHARLQCNRHPAPDSCGSSAGGGRRGDAAASAGHPPGTVLTLDAVFSGARVDMQALRMQHITLDVAGDIVRISVAPELVLSQATAPDVGIGAGGHVPSATADSEAAPLVVALPCSVDEADVVAKFSRKTGALSIVLKPA